MAYGRFLGLFLREHCWLFFDFISRPCRQDRGVDTGMLVVSVRKVALEKARRAAWVPVTNNHLLIIQASQLLHSQLICAGTVFMAN